MSKTIFETIIDNHNLSSKVSLTTQDPQLGIKEFGTLIFDAEKGTEKCQIIFSFVAQNNQIDLSIVHPPLLKTSCLILCGIALMGPILDCYKKANNWNDFTKCLEDQGHTLGTTALICIAGCG